MKFVPRVRSKSLQRASLIFLIVMPFVLYFAISNDNLAIAAAALAIMAAGMLAAVLAR